MTRRTLLAVTGLALFTVSCDRQPTEPPAAEPSAVIRDGTDADGNKDFFFLPPLVPLPIHHPNFEVGDFNPDVAPSVEVRICELNSNNRDAQGLPTGQTTCGPIKKTFGPGTVKLVKLPLVENGWWRLHNIPDDGFYYVLWDTRASNLSTSKFYRITVLLAGVELGIADVDPMSGLREFRHLKSDRVVQIIDDIWLPIPFRIENGALCQNPVGCVEKTITADNPTGDYQVIATEDASGQTIAGGVFPDGWLPTGNNPDGTPRPTSVVVRIERVETGTPTNGVYPNPCHVGTPESPFTHQQFNGCFNFSTFPDLQPINPSHPLEPTRTFAVDVVGVVCIELDREDPRFHFLQLWASDRNKTPVEAPHALKSTSVPEGFLQNDDCDGVYSALHPEGRFALVSNALRKVAAGFGRVFGVKEARAVDLGLGGLMPEFSNVGPVLSAELRRVTPATQTLEGDETTVSVTARVFGTHLHDGRPLAEGLPGMPVTFTLAPGNGTIDRAGEEGGEEEDTPTRLVVISSPESEYEEGNPAGYASVEWTPPTEPGTYTLVARSQAAGDAGGDGVTFTVTVLARGDINGVVWRGTGNESYLPGTLLELLGPTGAVIATDIANDVTSIWRFLNLPAGSYSVRASNGGYITQTLTAVVVGGEVTTLEFHLLPQTGAFFGFVRNARTNAPIPGASVQVIGTGSLSAVTDAEGEYRFTSVQPGNYTVRASMIDHDEQDQSISITAGGNAQLDFALEPEVIFHANFTGNATDVPPGAPSIGAWDFIDNTDGSILVRPGVSGLSGPALEVKNNGVVAGTPFILGRVIGAPGPTTGRYAVKWRSLVTASCEGFWDTTISVTTANGNSMGTVIYLPNGQLNYGNSFSAEEQVATWAPGVPLDFQVIVDLDDRTSSLLINGMDVEGAQNREFSVSETADLSNIRIGGGGTACNTLAFDDFEVRWLLSR